MLSSDRDQLAAFSQGIWRLTHPETPEGFSFPTWEAAFRALADLPGRPIVVLDEFTYLISGNKAIPYEDRAMKTGPLIRPRHYQAFIWRAQVANFPPFHLELGTEPVCQIADPVL